MSARSNLEAAASVAVESGTSRVTVDLVDLLRVLAGHDGTLELAGAVLPVMVDLGPLTSADLTITLDHRRLGLIKATVGK